MSRLSICSNSEYFYKVTVLAAFFITLTCLSCVQGKNFAAKILALCPEWMVMTFFPVNGLVIAICWSSEPERMYWPVSFQHTVFTCENVTIVLLKILKCVPVCMENTCVAYEVTRQPRKYILFDVSLFGNIDTILCKNCNPQHLM